MIPSLDRDRPLSLYIHVPFCSRKCDYCAFYSLPESAVREGERERWLRLLLSELDAVNREWGRSYETIFLGGGNPGLLGVETLGRILEKATENGLGKECTIETNPENLTEDFRLLSPMLTRVSIGIQSLDEEVLRTLGRNSTRESGLRALELLPSLPFDFNADIITAVPGESMGTALSDVSSIASFGPGHISLYCLSIEEGTPLSMRAVPIGGEKEAEFLENCWKLLSALGYEHYEVSNFAKKGKRCLHNLVYWNLGQYIGLGAGAESSTGYREVVSMRENESLSRYLKAPEMTCSRLTLEEAEEEYLLTSLRTSDGISKSEYRKRFSEDFDALYSSRMAYLEKSWYQDSPERFSLTEEGFLFLDRIILELAMGLGL